MYGGCGPRQAAHRSSGRCKTLTDPDFSGARSLIDAPPPFRPAIRLAHGLRGDASACGSRANACHSCPARSTGICGGAAPATLESLDRLAGRLVARPGQSLARQGEPATGVYTVVSGSVRLFRLTPGGRRQILSFLFPGDIFGLTDGDLYVFSAEAIQPSELCRLPAVGCAALAGTAPDLASAIMDRTRRELAAAQRQALTLGRRTALERVSTFLVEMSEREVERSGTGLVISLPMTRGEIADYLGLTIETVSRVLGRLKAARVISGSDVQTLRIDRLAALRRFADG